MRIFLQRNKCYKFHNVKLEFEISVHKVTLLLRCLILNCLQPFRYGAFQGLLGRKEQNLDSIHPAGSFNIYRYLPVCSRFVLWSETRSNYSKYLDYLCRFHRQSAVCTSRARYLRRISVIQTHINCLDMSVIQGTVVIYHRNRFLTSEKVTPARLY